ncbi:hypothetical protein [Streptomyces sp. NPDC015350]|uniref:hypothetical protein n=1 Tax=Streptomyces sp. NPDC015350 TaxID=3364955 RepID=UPI0036FA11CA
MDSELENPDFESPDVSGDPGRSRAYGPDSSPMIPGWEVVEKGVEIHTLAPKDRPPSDARQALRLRGSADEPGRVRQTIATTVHSSTTVRWVDSPAPTTPHGDPRAQGYSVTVHPVTDPDAGRTTVQYFPVEGPGFKWCEKSITFTPTTDHTALELWTLMDGSTLGAYVTGFMVGNGPGPVPPTPGECGPLRQREVCVRFDADRAYVLRIERNRSACDVPGGQNQVYYLDDMWPDFAVTILRDGKDVAAGKIGFTVSRDGRVDIVFKDQHTVMPDGCTVRRGDGDYNQIIFAWSRRGR